MKKSNLTNNKIYKRISVGFSKEELEQIIKLGEFNGLTVAPIIRMATIEFLRKNIAQMGTLKWFWIVSLL